MSPPRSNAQIQLNSDRLVNSMHIELRYPARTIQKSSFGDGSNLISHRLMLLAPDGDVRLTWKQPSNVRGQRNHLDTVQMLIGSVVADNRGRPFLAHFSTSRRRKPNPPHLTALHQQCLPTSHPPIRALRSRVPPPAPSGDIRNRCGDLPRVGAQAIQ